MLNVNVGAGLIIKKIANINNMLHNSFKNDIALGALKMFKPNDLAAMAGYISQYRLSEYLLWDYVNADGYDFKCTREQLLKLNPNLKPYLKDINEVEGKSKAPELVNSKILAILPENKRGKFDFLSVHIISSSDYNDRLSIIPHDVFYNEIIDTKDSGLTLDFNPPTKLIFGNDYGYKHEKTKFTKLFEKWEVKNFNKIISEQQ
tara:strand:+ start:1237 stop:1848 length:612 start_codon:yes stop_codon:yes gene_type:complete